jgi:ArsR family transcriptional regulator
VNTTAPKPAEAPDCCAPVSTIGAECDIPATCAPVSTNSGVAAAAQLASHSAQLGALGNPLRLAILRIVVAGDSQGTAVGDIQAKVGVPWSTLSHHLERLTQSGLLTPRQEGRFIFHRADYAALRQLTNYLWEDCCRGGPSACCP